MFFTSVKHPGLSMNKWGVVFALRSHEAANGDLWRGVEWKSVPLKSGYLSLKEAVEDEAREAGYTYTYVKGERLYRKPERSVTYVPAN